MYDQIEHRQLARVIGQVVGFERLRCLSVLMVIYDRSICFFYSACWCVDGVSMFNENEWLVICALALGSVAAQINLFNRGPDILELAQKPAPDHGVIDS